MLMRPLEILVIGGNSQIGSSLLSNKKFKKFNLISTSRKTSGGNIFFDLSQPDYSQFIKASSDVAIILAGITNIANCQSNPEYSNLVNVENTINLIRKLVNDGAFVVYLSSAAVYDGASKNTGELQPVSPNTLYGAQKSSVENVIINTPILSSRVAILRPTKILSKGNLFFFRCLMDLKNKEKIQMLEDYYFSPITMEYTLTAIFHLIHLKTGGIFHVSSNENISYFNFFKRVAVDVGVNSELVLPISKLTSGKTFLNQGKFPRLSMPRTTEMLGIYPQKISDVIKEFVYEY